ncbi:MAG: hypothetical protein KF784_12780 [Fimbriimonadaceae bacterium]|nr:hypothetical protein [Fimbriimonadaceae bacterium]
MSLVLQTRVLAGPKPRAIPDISWGKRLFPLFLLQVHLWLSLALYAFGPWHWPMRDPQKLFGFVIACHVALAAGYFAVAHCRPRALSIRWRGTTLVYWGIVASLLVLPITCYARTGHWMPDLASAIADPGEAYLQAHLYTANSSNAAAYVRVLLSPLLVMLFPMAAFYWNRLSGMMRIAVVVLAIWVVLLSIATGQRRDIADLIVTIPFICIASHWARITSISRAARTIMVTLLIALIGAFLTYFTYSHISRVGANTATYAANPATQQLPDRDNPILGTIPDDARPGFLAFANYLTTGYYGLSLSLDREQKPMYGMGHSMFLTRNYERFTGDKSFAKRSLPVQISDKDGFKYPVYWCTAYPYMINDLGTIGTVLLMFGVGVLFALTWIDTLGGKNPFAIVLFWLLAIFLFYLPATNRMLQDGEGVIAFYVWLVLYLYHRMSYRRRAAE